MTARGLASGLARQLASQLAGSGGGGGTPSWDVVPVPAITGGYALLTHEQEVYYDSNLAGYAFRPASLYTDTTGTTPATTAGDLIARWDDETTASGLSMRQATAGNRPALQFVRNSVGIYVPVVRFSRLADYLGSVASVTLWPAKRGGIYAAYKANTSLVKNPFGWAGGIGFTYSWFPFRFYDGNFAGATTGFDNGLRRFSVIRTSDLNRGYYEEGVFKENRNGPDSAAAAAILQMPFNSDWSGDHCGIIADDIGVYNDDIDNYLAATSPAYTDKPKIVVCDGNSLTIGNGATNPLGSYPDQLQTLLSEWTVKNVGVASQQTPAMITNAATRVDALHTAATHKVTVCWEATNHLYFGATATTAYNSIVTYCQARQAAGQKVVVLTVLPRSDGSFPASFEADRQTVNTNIRTNWATFADALADVAADDRIGDEDDELDTTYYAADKVHMKSVGYAMIAEIVKDAIDSIDF